MSSLKEIDDRFAGRHGAPEEQDVADSETLARHDREPKTRSCLICKSPFPSAWAGERVCRRCKSTSTWRSGGME